jgi:hypothetical protein
MEANRVFYHLTQVSDLTMTIQRLGSNVTAVHVIH